LSALLCRVAKAADVAFNAAVCTVVPAPPELSELVYKDVVQQFLPFMTKAIRDPPQPITHEQILTAWSCFVVLIGPRLLFKNLINEMLMIPRVCYSARSLHLPIVIHTSVCNAAHIHSTRTNLSLVVIPSLAVVHVVCFG
jgi:hypothetical protein